MAKKEKEETAKREAILKEIRTLAEEQEALIKISEYLKEINYSQRLKNARKEFDRLKKKGYL